MKLKLKQRTVQELSSRMYFRKLINRAAKTYLFSIKLSKILILKRKQCISIIDKFLPRRKINREKVNSVKFDKLK